jgi:hypothetical protein
MTISVHNMSVKVAVKSVDSNNFVLIPETLLLDSVHANDFRHPVVDPP